MSNIPSADASAHQHVGLPTLPQAMQTHCTLKQNSKNCYLLNKCGAKRASVHVRFCFCKFLLPACRWNGEGKSRKPMCCSVCIIKIRGQRLNTQQSTKMALKMEFGQNRNTISLRENSLTCLEIQSCLKRRRKRKRKKNYSAQRRGGGAITAVVFLISPASLAPPRCR